jgi:hypothetical protein
LRGIAADRIAFASRARLTLSMRSARSPLRQLAVLLVAVALSWALVGALAVAILVEDVTLAGAVGGAIVAACAATLISGDRLRH